MKFSPRALIPSEISQHEAMLTMASYQVNASSQETSVIEYIDQVIADANTAKASDIHFEPHQHFYRIRLRIDGVLQEYDQPAKCCASQLTVRLKVMAKLDITESRLPQDGYIHHPLKSDSPLDIRINTLPSLWGEKVVLRLQQQNQQMNSLSLMTMFATSSLINHLTGV